MNQSKSVGIIIPTYNVEPYIKDCLDSIINQTYTNWKAVIIDDCGTDNSIQIAEDYQKQYPDKFHIIRHEQNEGQGYARNTGIEYFTETQPADFLVCIDPDDYWQHNLLEQCVTNIGDADIAWFDYEWGNGWGEDNTLMDIMKIPRHTHTLTSQQWLRLNSHLKKAGTIFYCGWSAMFSTEFIKRAKIKSLTVKHEDAHFGVSSFLKSCKIAVIPEKLYYYRYVPTGLVLSSGWEQQPSRWQHLKEHFSNFKEAKSYLSTHGYIVQFCDLVKNLHTFNQDIKEIEKHILTTYREVINHQLKRLKKDPYGGVELYIKATERQVRDTPKRLTFTTKG